MRISVIPADRSIIVNGVAVQLPADVPFPETDADIEAIQWQGDALYGTEQRKSGTTPFSDPAALAPYIEAFHAEMERRLEKQWASFQAMRMATGERHRIELALRKALDEQQAAAVAAQTT